MTPSGEDARAIRARDSSSVRRTVLVHSCPRKEHCTENGQFCFQKGSGFTNPYNHLKTCISGGDESHIRSVFFGKLEERRRGQNIFATKRSLVLGLNAKEKVIYGYVRVVVLKSWLISCVSDPDLRVFSKHDIVFTKGTFKQVLFSLVELVEEKIRTEIKGGKGALTYDWCTDNGTHYVGLFVLYSRRVRILKNGGEVWQTEPVAPLISVGPMAQISEDDDDQSNVLDSTQEATQFSADVYIRLFEDIFHHVYQTNVHDWALCQIAVSCSVNKLIALMEIPHVGCANHRLHHEVRKMIKSDTSLS